jgi:hypothetical protein
LKSDEKIMHISKEMITKVMIEDAPGVPDAIELFMQDLGPKKGSISVRYAGNNWSTSWNAMANPTVMAFIAGCPVDYLIDCLCPMSEVIEDLVKMKLMSIREVLRLRRQNDLSPHVARDLYDRALRMSSAHSSPDLMCSIWGGEWWHQIPTMENPVYRSTECVMTAIRAALRQLITTEQVAA